MNCRFVLATVTSAAAVLALTVGPATAATSSAAPAQAHGNKKVCATAPAGFAACHARVVTDNAKSLRPMATTGPTGYSPVQLKSAYGLTGFNGTTTIAIVDAYANPNAAADLAVYATRSASVTPT